MSKLTHTRYRDYHKYDILMRGLYRTEKNINYVHFNDPHIQGQKGIVNLSERLKDERAKVWIMRGAIDRINFILKKYSKYILDVDVSTSDIDDDDDLFNTMLADIKFDPFLLAKYNLDDLGELLHEMEGAPLTIISNISLPLPTSKDDILGYKCINATVFIDDHDEILQDDDRNDNNLPEQK